MSITEKLLNVQAKLKVPKSQFNSFGKYSFRSCEDILETAKPLLQEEKLLLTLRDGIELIGDRYYIRAIATIQDTETGEEENVTAYARETENKSGMDASQITGAASSYARKYALNGLFCIDDTKDADTEEGPTENLSDAQINRLFAIAYSKGIKRDSVKAQVKKAFNKAVEELTKAEYDKACNGYQNTKGGNK